MITVKVTTNFPNWPLLRQTPGYSGQWGQCQFYVNQDKEECDYWVVFDGLLKEETSACAPKNIILITGEPETVRKYDRKFLRQFSLVISCQSGLRHNNVLLTQQAHPWFVERSYDELSVLKPFLKEKLMSIVVSDKCFTEGHRARYEFANKLKKYFGNRVDLYGRGLNSFTNKWEVLAPYKYSVAIENFETENWLTEKLPDCLLAFCFPFYFGCSNIEDYFDARAYCRMDISSAELSICAIERIIENPTHYEESLPFIQQARARYLDELQFFPFVTHIIAEMGHDGSHSSKRICRLFPE